ncbi:50S ribosomal protein L25 [Patescibacteria group bacterium]|nr:50S ribosomal protein L25 [Patescibacteria group bacterium]
MATKTPVLPAGKRDKSVLAKNLRKQDMVPAEYYGHGVENLSLQLDYQTFRKVFREAGENTVIDLKIEGIGDKKVLVQQVDRDPVSNEYSHVELINVRMDEEVTTHVPIELEGQAPAVRELAGVLVQNLDEIEIRCLPGDLIHGVTLNIEVLVDFQTSLHVSDIKLPANITLLTDPELMVATVQPPREEEIEEVAPEAAEGAVQEGEKAEATESGADAKEAGGE